MFSASLAFFLPIIFKKQCFCFLVILHNVLWSYLSTSPSSSQILTIPLPPNDKKGLSHVFFLMLFSIANHLSGKGQERKEKARATRCSFLLLQHLWTWHSAVHVCTHVGTQAHTYPGSESCKALILAFKTHVCIKMDGQLMLAKILFFPWTN